MIIIDLFLDSVGSLSGGWKMKLELARAMLMNVYKYYALSFF